jgi:hypothetical protein
MESIKNRRLTEDRGQDNSIEIDLILDNIVEILKKLNEIETRITAIEAKLK